MNQTVIDRPRTPYDTIGGVEAVRRLVDRFYDLMDSDPSYDALRKLHAPDLDPMREALTLFLTAWLGGPRDWFIQRPNACIMSAHAKIDITPQTAREWLHAMDRAMRDTGVEDQPRAMINEAFGRMAQGMVMR